MLGLPSYATVYNMVPAGITYNQATASYGTIETDRIGTFRMLDIAGIFNASTYSFSMYDGATLLAQMDNSNSSWALLSGGFGTVTITPTAITFQFQTPGAYSDEYLYVRSIQPDGRWYSAQFMQSNNISNHTTIGSNFDASHRSEIEYQYNAPVVFEAVTPVPEPSASILVLLGFLALVLARAQASGRKQIM